MKKIRKVIKFLSKKLNILQEKVNMLYVAISILVVVAIGALIGSCWMPESYNDVKNIVVGLSTGIITSALVTVYIENINASESGNIANSPGTWGNILTVEVYNKDTYNNYLNII